MLAAVVASAAFRSSCSKADAIRSIAPGVRPSFRGLLSPRGNCLPYLRRDLMCLARNHLKIGGNFERQLERGRAVIKIDCRRQDAPAKMIGLCYIPSTFAFGLSPLDLPFPKFSHATDPENGTGTERRSRSKSPA